MQELETAGKRLVNAMQASGYTESTTDVFSRVIKRIEDFSRQRRFAGAEQALKAFYERSQSMYASGEIGLLKFLQERRTTSRLRNACEDDEIAWRIPHVGDTSVSKGFSEAIDQITSSECWTSEPVMRAVASAMRMMFAWFSERGMAETSDMTRAAVLQYYMERSAQLKAVPPLRQNLARGLAIAKRLGLVDFDCTAIFKLRTPSCGRLLPAVSDDVVARALGEIDLDTELGRRDYAMILLGADTGLRPVDIVNLRVSDINWRDGTLSVVQHKTAQPIGLPLSAGVVEALREYALNWRPKMASGSLFVRCRAPRGKMDSRTPGKRFVAYAKSAGVDCAPDLGVTFYALRRRLGRNLASSRVPMTTISQVLGHGDLRSSESYMALSPSILVECPLDFRGIEPGGAK